jgi:glutathione synthase/RimK-type ligase-like ATP-grasp enzyme
MTKIIALTDYKNKFGSKHFDSPYRSGMDKEKLKKYFNELDLEIEFHKLHEVTSNLNILKGQFVLYTSSEDIGYYYKSFIEDIVLILETVGAKTIPSYKHLRANNNKVFMELMRQEIKESEQLSAFSFGSLNDFLSFRNNISYPCVFKTAEGASGTGVFLANTEEELIKIIKKNNKVSNPKENLKDYLRSKKHKGYLKEDIYRRKFIVQQFIPNLKNDWKLYIFGDMLYVFNRPIQKGRGIKASGGGYDNYLYGPNANTPEGLFEFAYMFFLKLNVPHVSLDVAYDGKQFYIIEFQSVYFGTAGIPYSNGYYKKTGSNWLFVNDKLEIENVYAKSINWFLK